MHCHMGFAENARELVDEVRAASGTSVDSASADQAPVVKMLVGNPPVVKMPVDQVPADQVPADGACDLLKHPEAATSPSASRVPAGVLCVTVEPSEFERVAGLADGTPQVRVGLGLHPWWVADGRCGCADVARFEALAQDACFIGEVGLDLSPRWEKSREVQLTVFERVVAACVSSCEGLLPDGLPDDVRSNGSRGFSDRPSGAAAPFSRKVISLHAVRAAGEVMDVLERHDAFARHACIFHWFSGTSDELQRAIRLGAYFSIGKRMLVARRGAAYARAIPEDRLLLETDYPGEPCSVATCAEWSDQMEDALSLLAEVRNEDRAQLALLLERNSLALLA